MDFASHHRRALDQLTSEKAEALATIGIERRVKGLGSSHTVVVYPSTISLHAESKSIDEIVQDFDGSAVDLYLHIPLCEHPCTFCHYHTDTKVPDQLGPDDTSFVELLLTEARSWRDAFAADNGRELKMRSLYVGGGTGFILDAPTLRRLLRVFEVIPPITKGFQFCIESSAIALARNDAVEKLKLLSEWGLSRVSIGVQTIAEDILRLRGRGLSRTAVDDTLKTARQIADRATARARDTVPNVNCDLMLDITDGHGVELVGADLDWFSQSGADSLTIYIQRLHPGSTLFDRIGKSVETNLRRTRQSGALRLAAESYLSELGFAAAPGGRFRKGSHADLYKESRGSQKATLLGLGRSAYSRVGPHFFRGALESDRWRQLVASSGTGIALHHLVTEPEELEGKLIADIRDKLPLSRMETYLKSHPLQAYRTQVTEFVQNLLTTGLAESSDGFLSLTALGRAFEEEICWLLYPQESRSLIESFYANPSLRPELIEKGR